MPYMDGMGLLSIKISIRFDRSFFCVTDQLTIDFLL